MVWLPRPLVLVLLHVLYAAQPVLYSLPVFWLRALPLLLHLRSLLGVFRVLYGRGRLPPLLLLLRLLLALLDFFLVLQYRGRQPLLHVALLLPLHLLPIVLLVLVLLDVLRAVLLIVVWYNY